MLLLPVDEFDELWLLLAVIELLLASILVIGLAVRESLVLILFVVSCAATNTPMEVLPLSANVIAKRREEDIVRIRDNSELVLTRSSKDFTSIFHF